MFFNKSKKEKNKDDDFSSLKKEVNELIESHKGIKSDITYLESQYESFILRSLILEYDVYKEAMEKNKNEGQEKKFWMIDRIRTNSFILRKYTDSRVGCRFLTIEVEHNGRIDGDFQLKEVDISSDKTIKLDPSKFKYIIFKYIMLYTILVSKDKLTSTKKSFESVSNFIGKEIYRDSKIDEIIG